MVGRQLRAAPRPQQRGPEAARLHARRRWKRCGAPTRRCTAPACPSRKPEQQIAEQAHGVPRGPGAGGLPRRYHARHHPVARPCGRSASEHRDASAHRHGRGRGLRRSARRPPDRGVAAALPGARFSASAARRCRRRASRPGIRPRRSRWAATSRCCGTCPRSCGSAGNCCAGCSPSRRTCSSAWMRPTSTSGSRRSCARAASAPCSTWRLGLGLAQPSRASAPARGRPRAVPVPVRDRRCYEQAGVPVSYVGHPLADQVPEVPDRQGAREQFRLSSAQTVVALLPGQPA